MEKTKQEIRDAVPHEDAFWNCWHCKKQVLGCSFVSYPAKEEYKSPAACVHIFDCSMAYRRRFNIVWDWEEDVGVPKRNYDFEGNRVDAEGNVIPEVAGDDDAEEGE